MSTEKVKLTKDERTILDAMRKSGGEFNLRHASLYAAPSLVKRTLKSLERKGLVKAKEQAYGIYVLTRKNPGIFGSQAVAKAKRVTKIRKVRDKDTGQVGEIVGTAPQGFVKVKWVNRDKPTLIKRSEITLARGKQNPHSSYSRLSAARTRKAGNFYRRAQALYKQAAQVSAKGDEFTAKKLAKQALALQRRFFASGAGAGSYPKGTHVEGPVGKLPNPAKGKLLKLYHVYAGKENLGGVEATSASQALRKIANHPKVQGGRKLTVKLARRYQHRINPTSDAERIRRLRRLLAGRTVEGLKMGDPGLSKEWIQQHLYALEQQEDDRKFRIRERQKKAARKNPAKGSRDAFGVWHPNPKRYSRAKEHREFRRREYNQLKSLPFLSTEQVARFDWLKKQVVKDNKYAFEEAKKARNPSVAALSEKFQGEADGAIEQFYAASSAPANLARAGKLVFLKIEGKIFRPPNAMVAIAPNEKLWIVSRTSTPIFATKAKAGQGLDVGEITAICYETAKQHIGNGKIFEYVHEFGEDGGKRPHLIIDHEGMPILRGGDYKIKTEGIVN